MLAAGTVSTNDFKNGLTVEIDGQPFRVMGALLRRWRKLTVHPDAAIERMFAGPAWHAAIKQWHAPCRVHAREAGQGRSFCAVKVEKLRDRQHSGAHFQGRRAGRCPTSVFGSVIHEVCLKHAERSAAHVKRVGSAAGSS